MDNMRNLATLAASHYCVLLRKEDPMMKNLRIVGSAALSVAAALGAFRLLDDVLWAVVAGVAVFGVTCIVMSRDA